MRCSCPRRYDNPRSGELPTARGRTTYLACKRVSDRVLATGQRSLLTAAGGALDQARPVTVIGPANGVFVKDNTIYKKSEDLPPSQERNTACCSLERMLAQVSPPLH